MGDSSSFINLSSKNPKILDVAQKAYNKLYERGSYSPNDLLEVDEYRALVDQTSSIFNSAISHEISGEMTSYLQQDSFVFSGLKTHTQLTEVRSYLLNEQGHIRPYKDFEEKVIKLNKRYNKNYLEAEYEYAVQSAQSVEAWEGFSNNTERYSLQYRTAGDDKVRESHLRLEGTTLPKDDPFWNEYFPPLGWRCRCTTVEVKASRYVKSNSAASIEVGKAATTQIGENGKNKLAMFRYNPAKARKLFPPTNSYTKVAEASKLIPELKQKANEQAKYYPKGLDDYEKALDIKVNSEIFEYLNKDTPLVQNSTIGATGAYYNPHKNYVRIPIDQRRKDSKWYSQAVVHHEFGHAADYHNGFRTSKKVKALMTKYKKKYKEAFNTIHINLRERYCEAEINFDSDSKEKIGAIADTIKALNPNYGWGHSKAYFERKNNKEIEFIAHMFENTFSGNDIFKSELPDLYEDMIKVTISLKPK